MNASYRRYEILLPRQFNDGLPVPDDMFAETLLELRRKFGAVSSETQIIRGIWQHEGEIYRDDLVRVFVDVVDDQESLQFFQELKEKLKDRFKQLDIWLTSYPIDVL